MTPVSPQDLQRARIVAEHPMSLPSCANLAEHWRTKAKRAKAHRLAGRIVTLDRAGSVRLPLTKGQMATITLTRIAARKLDSDNVASAFKAVRDGVADALGVDDGSPRLEWRYAQEKGAPRVRIEVEITQGSEGAES